MKTGDSPLLPAARGRLRGSGLPTVLMVSALLLVAAFTIVGLGFNHLSVSNRLNASAEARCLAEAAVAKGIEELQVNKLFGQSGYTGNPTSINVTFPSSPQDATGRLTFDSSQASAWGIRRSTNNFDGTGSVAGEGAAVPKDAVHLVGVGTCNGVTRTVDAVLYLPKYPFAISSSGAVETEGGLYVASVDSETDIPDPSKHTKGHLVTNSNAGANAVKLEGSGNKITGDLQSRSGATIGTSVIEGETRLNAAAADIPDVDIASFDTTGKTGLRTLTSDTGPVTTSASPMAGFVRFDGGGTRTLTFDELHLDKGVMYVDGNLQVNQGIFGKGAIIVKGTTTIRGGGSFTSDNGVALLSGQKIDVAGDTASPSTFKGLMYSEGGLASKDMKLRGVFVNNDQTSSPAPTNATNSEVIQLADNAQMEFQVPTSPGSPGGGSDNVLPAEWSANIEGAPTGSLEQPDGAFGTGPNSSGLMLTPPPPEPSFSFDVNIHIGLRKDPGFDPETFRLGSEYAIGYQAGAEVRRSLLVAPGYEPAPAGTQVLGWQHLRVKVGGQDFMGTDNWQQPLRDHILAQAAAAKGSALTPAQETMVLNWANGKIASLESGTGFQQLSMQASTAMEMANQVFQSDPAKVVVGTYTPATPATSEPWKINLSDFINRNERVRILYWRET